MRAVFFLTLLFCAASCTAPGAAGEGSNSTPTAHSCGRAGDPVMVRPFDADGRTQVERDLETIGRDEARVEEPATR